MFRPTSLIDHEQAIADFLNQVVAVAQAGIEHCVDEIETLGPPDEFGVAKYRLGLFQIG